MLINIFLLWLKSLPVHCGYCMFIKMGLPHFQQSLFYLYEQLLQLLWVNISGHVYAYVSWSNTLFTLYIAGAFCALELWKILVIQWGKWTPWRTCCSCYISTGTIIGNFIIFSRLSHLWKVSRWMASNFQGDLGSKIFGRFWTNRISSSGFVLKTRIFTIRRDELNRCYFRELIDLFE